MNYQKLIVRGDEYSRAKANYITDQLDTPEYDQTEKSCLTHVFEVLEAGGKDAPETSPTNLSTAKYMKGSKKSEPIIRGDRI
jgi:hypothetical protein